jgi:GT2 family glycosyltransferase
MGNISIILVHFHHIDITWECVESLTRMTFGQFNIIIVDNGADKSDRKMFENHCLKHDRHFQILENQQGKVEFGKTIYWYTSSENLGYAGAMNLGARLSGSGNPDFLLFMNNDTLVPERFLDEFLGGIKSVADRVDFGFAGCLIRSWPDNRVWYAGGSFNPVRCMGEHFEMMPDFNMATETGFLTGCCMICRPAVYKKLNGMDADFFLYLEDVDLCYRARKEGYKLFFVPSTEIYHRVGSSTGGDEKPLSIYYSSRNRIWLMRKHFKGYILNRFFVFFFLSRLLKLCKWSLSGKLDLVTSLLKGIRDGLYRKKIN